MFEPVFFAQNDLLSRVTVFNVTAFRNSIQTIKPDFQAGWEVSMSWTPSHSLYLTLVGQSLSSKGAQKYDKDFNNFFNSQDIKQQTNSILSSGNFSLRISNARVGLGFLFYEIPQLSFWIEPAFAWLLLHYHFFSSANFTVTNNTSFELVQYSVNGFEKVITAYQGLGPSVKLGLVANLIPKRLQLDVAALVLLLQGRIHQRDRVNYFSSSTGMFMQNNSVLSHFSTNDDRFLLGSNFDIKLSYFMLKDEKLSIALGYQFELLKFLTNISNQFNDTYDFEFSLLNPNTALIGMYGAYAELGVNF
jgi:hypothetical protein